MIFTKEAQRMMWIERQMRKAGNYTFGYYYILQQKWKRKCTGK